MRLFAFALAFALAGCVTTPPTPIARGVGDAYASYAIALNIAADYADQHGDNPHAAHTITAMAAFNDSPVMSEAVFKAQTYLICKAPTPHSIPDYDCNTDLSDKAMRPVVKQLDDGSFTLRQAVFSIKDMHGQDTRVGKETSHDAH